MFSKFSNEASVFVEANAGLQTPTMTVGEYFMDGSQGWGAAIPVAYTTVPNATGYKLYRSYQGSAFSPTILGASPLNVYLHSSSQAYEYYDFYTTAYNDQTESAPSPTVRRLGGLSKPITPILNSITNFNNNWNNTGVAKADVSWTCSFNEWGNTIHIWHLINGVWTRSNFNLTSAEAYYPTGGFINLGYTFSTLPQSIAITHMNRWNVESERSNAIQVG